MRSALLSGLVAAGVASAAGCDSGGGNPRFAFGAAGTTGAAGTDAAGASGTTDAAGTGAGAGIAGPPFAVANTASIGAFSEVAPTEGCGQPAPATGRQTIETMGVKDAQCADRMCGAWTFTREYFVNLPADYDNMKAYPLIFEGPGCGGKGYNLYNTPPLANMVIRIGLSPSADAQMFHATNPNQGCFDDKDGDDSIEWALYENLWDLLATQVCFDRNRVFAAGDGSGALLANELGCKYAGDAKRPIRGVMPHNGTLLPSIPPPDSPQQGPTCSSNPMAGIWVWGNKAPETETTNAIPAINRALQVNGCTSATYQTAMFVPFPISSTDATSCKKIADCPDATPLVTCSLPVFPRYGDPFVVDPAWLTFLELFLASPPPTR